jgi:chromate reductase
MADPLRIACLVGSLRKDSYNRRLALAIERVAGDRLVFTHTELAGLPLYNQDDEQRMAPAALRLKSEIDAAQGVLLVTPEYNRGMTGVLKNAVDIASRPYGKNSFARKPVATAGISVGPIGTATAQQQLRAVMVHLDAVVLGQPEIYMHWKDGLIDADGRVGPPDTEAFLGRFVDRFAGWVRQHA